MNAKQFRLTVLLTILACLLLACSFDQALPANDSPGMAVDEAGTAADNAPAADTAGPEGAGSANGLGVLFDATGDDRYYVKSMLNTQGYGNPRRDYGSIGVFLDGAGTDRYDGPGADGTWWQVRSRWGIGIDWSDAGDHD